MAQLCTPPKKSVINCTWLRLSISHWLITMITMIGPGGLLLVVPHVYAVSVLLVGLPKEKAKLRHLILLSRGTY